MAMRSAQPVSSRPAAMGGGMMSPPNGMGMVPPAHKGTLPPGTRVQVGQITVTVQKYLSEGGFAHVYLVKTNQPIPLPAAAGAQPGAEYTHVLKRMAVPDKDMLAHVRGEVEIHRSLRSHPNLVHFIEACATALPGGGYEVFILMEFCSGGGLIDMMNAHLRTRLSEPDVLRIFCDVASGLSAMHHSSPPLMHRDLKVENVLLSPAPGRKGGVTYKLCDFGSAKQILSRRAPRSVDEVRKLEDELNRTTTLQYRAPEMVDVGQRRVIDEKADVWAMGVLLYKLCYYTTPFEENGGGPLAILNARYRFPSSPTYSQGVKALIASMLQEQSTSRPSIDELVIRAHKLLGTRPPSSVVHYAELAASGKVVSELPSLRTASGTELDADAAAKALLPRKSEIPAAADVTPLIDMAPSKEEVARLEQQARQERAEAITPMRRGRPAKAAAPPSTGDKVVPNSRSEFPDFSSNELPLAAVSAGGFSDTFAPSPSLGFGDSFAPNPSQAPAVTSKPADASRLQVEDVGPGARTTPLSHSPALPGFSASPSPRISPAASPLSPASVREGEVSQRKDADNEATSRFPSVEELDARYAPGSSDREGKKHELPGISSRPTVGAVASRFGTQGKAPSSSALSHSSLNTGPSLSARWPALADENQTPSLPTPSSSTLHRSKTAAENRHSVADFSRKGPTRENPESLRFSGVQSKDVKKSPAPHLPARKPMPKDWLVDAAHVDRPSSSMSHESSAAAAKAKLSAPAELTQAASYRSPARFGKTATDALPARGHVSDESSGAEDEGPEDAAPARRPVSMVSPGSAHTPAPSKQAPGRVQAPSWLVSDADASGAKPEASTMLLSPPPISSSPGSTAVPSTNEATSSPLPASPRTRAEGQLPNGSSTAASRAPAWDEDDEEQRAMAFDGSDRASYLITAKAAGRASVTTPVGSLIDLGVESGLNPTDYVNDVSDKSSKDHGNSSYSRSVAKLAGSSRLDSPSMDPAVAGEHRQAVATPSLSENEDESSSFTRKYNALDLNGNDDVDSANAANAGVPATTEADADPSSASSQDFMKRFPALDVESTEREIRARSSPLPTKLADARQSGGATKEAGTKVSEAHGNRSLLTNTRSLASRAPEPRIIKPQARPAPKVAPGFVRERQKSLTGASQRPTSVDLAPPVPQARGARLPGFAGRQDEEQASGSIGSASRAPVKTGALKPWEREAVEREAADRSSVVRNRAAASPGNSSPNSHSPKDGQAEAAPEVYSGVSKLVSQWQENAGKGKPGWGRVGGNPDSRRANEAKLFNDAARQVASRAANGVSPGGAAPIESASGSSGGVIGSAIPVESVVGNSNRRPGADV